jgi:hypothetical protein
MTPLGDNRVLLGTEKETAAAKQLSCLVLDELSDYFLGLSKRCLT